MQARGFLGEGGEDEAVGLGEEGGVVGEQSGGEGAVQEVGEGGEGGGCGEVEEEEGGYELGGSSVFNSLELCGVCERGGGVGSMSAEDWERVFGVRRASR